MRARGSWRTEAQTANRLLRSHFFEVMEALRLGLEGPDNGSAATGPGGAQRADGGAKAALLAFVRERGPEAGISRRMLTDLLGRPERRFETEKLKRFFAAKRVLITGAAGSIGSALAERLALAGLVVAQVEPAAAGDLHRQEEAAGLEAGAVDQHVGVDLNAVLGHDSGFVDLADPVGQELDVVPAQAADHFSSLCDGLVRPVSQRERFHPLKTATT